MAASALGAFFWCLDEESEGDDVEVSDGVAVMSVLGPLEQRGGWWWDGYDTIQGRLEAALAREDVRSVVVRIDSPGGDVAGLFEAVKAMRAAKVAAGKPVYAYVDELAASAGYALACVADEIYLPPSGCVGSIGIITTLVDQTKSNEKWGLNIQVIASGARKADGNPDVPLTSGVIAETQRRVNMLAELFASVVSDARPSLGDPLALEAAVFYGEEAVSRGLADGIMSFADVISAAKALVADDPSSVGYRNSNDAPSPRGQTRDDMKLKTAKALEAARAELKAAEASKDATRIAAAYAAVSAIYKSESADSAGDSEEKCEHCGEPKGTSHTCTTTSVTKRTTSTSNNGEESAEGEEEDDDEEGGDEEEATTAAAPAPKTTAELGAMFMAATGATSVEDAWGRLAAMSENTKRLSSLEAEIASLKKDARASEKATLIAQASREGKLTPAQAKVGGWAWKQSLASLRGYLETAVAHTRSLDEEAIANPKAAASDGGITAEEKTIAERLGNDPSKLARVKGNLKAAGRFVVQPITKH